MNHKISIIMGVYNCAPTLAESIDSILAQTYTDWEFIICDDGSTDDTLQILRRYAEQHPAHFRVLVNERNLGLNATLNRCLRAANGAYIARQDGDDISAPDRFEKEVAFLDSHPEYALVSCHMSFFDENGVWGRWRTPEMPQRLDFFRNSPCFCHAPCMIRREAFLAVGGYTERERYLRCEDVNLWYKLYAAGYQGYNIQEPLYAMRDDLNAYKRRTLRNRMNIILTEWDGMRSLNCRLGEAPYFLKKAAKHIILAFLPQKLYKLLHQKRHNR